MFHQSESIIITSRDKSGGSSLEKPRTIRGRQRASTWSSPSFKEDSTNLNSPPGTGGETFEKRKFRNRFSISRKGSANNNSNAGGGGGLNVSGAAALAAGARFPIALQRQPSTPSSSSSKPNNAVNSPRFHLRRQSQDFPSNERSSVYHSCSIDEYLVEGDEVPEISVASPPRVSGVTKEGLVHWLSLKGSDLGANTNTNANTDTNTPSISFDSTSELENPVVPVKPASNGTQATVDTSDNRQSFMANATNNDSPTLIPRPSPSGSNESQDDCNDSMYPPNCKNILSGRIGMWTTHKDEEEEKQSFDYDDEQPNMVAFTDKHKNGEDSNDIPLVSTFEGSTSSETIYRTDSKDDTTINTDKGRSHNHGSNSFNNRGSNSSNNRGNNTLTQSLNIILSDYYDSGSDQDSDTDNMQQWDCASDVSTPKNTMRFLYLFNIPKPSWGRISSAVIRHAPCFWCCATVEISSTDRIILTKLNILCAILAIYQILIGVVYCIITLKQKHTEEGEVTNIYRQALLPNLWMPYTFIPLVAIIGFVLFIILISTVRAIRRVNLRGALQYMWALYWILPLQIFFASSFIDFHGVTDISIQHLWSTDYMAGFRKLLCESGGECECAVPLLPELDAQGAIDVAWCEETCGSPCGEYRNTAITRMSALSHSLFITNAIVGLFLALLLMLALFLLERIISAPIVKSSKESNIPLWLVFPTICSFLGGFYFIRQSNFDGNDESTEVSTQVRNHWIIGVCYTIAGAAFLASALLGWFIAVKTVLDNRDKNSKKIAVYLFIGMMVLTIFAIAAILIYSLIDSSSIVAYGLTDEERGKTACFLLDAGGWKDSCSNCNATLITEDVIENLPKCPEWSEPDVLKLTQSQMKQSAALASIFIIYALTALRFGFNLRTLVLRYEVDYV